MTTVTLRSGRITPRRRTARRKELVKRGVDLIICALAMPVVLVIAPLIVLAIRIDSAGPAIFRQPRTGRHGERFKMYKFRTMVRNAEELKPSLMHLNVLPFPDFKVPNDPRITRVGRFLRRTSLDELPQVINIVLGHMSWVGPRPTSFKPQTYDLWHTRRLEARPGLTGLWQVKLRHSSSFDERVRLDVHYLENASLLADMRILFATVSSVFRRTGV